MHLRKLTAAVIGSALLLSGLVGVPAEAGGHISPNVAQLGLDLRENSELGRMPTVLFGSSNPNDSKSYLICQDVNDPICTQATNVYGRFNYDVCNANSQLTCIAGAWAIDPKGNKIQAVFKKSMPDDPRYNTVENPAINLPASHGVGAVWEFPGVFNSAGLDTYFISVQSIVNMQKPSNKSISDSGKLTYGEYIAGIMPIQEQTGEYRMLTATDAAHGGNAWGSNGTQYAADGSPCAARDLTTCEAIKGFPSGYRFGLTIKFSDKLDGWFHGRLHLPNIVTTNWKTGESVSIEADPVLVPSLSFMVPNSEIPDPIRKIINSGREIGMGGDGINTAQISENLANQFTMDLVTGFAPAYKNTATTTDSFWSFKTLESGSGNVGRCAMAYGNLAGLVTTNALSYSAGPPTFDRATGTLVYKVASPHFQADGQAAVGTYDLSMRSDVARCIYGFSKAPINATVSVISQDGVQQVATTILSEKDGWLYLSANGFGYSNPTIKVRLTQESGAKSTITCIKGKTVKSVTAIKPTCPIGYKKK